MPLLLLPKGAVPSRRDYAEATTSQPEQWDKSELSDGVETPKAVQAPRSSSKRMSVTFGTVDVVRYSSEEASDMDGCDSDELTETAYPLTLSNLAD
mmetsp:Transcript_10573/g.23813  ORF Transcript_10573/g.23813 Transcript_10573/m.23813 type:complete len:96 (-) Transcript_10573:196-483(-)